MCCDYNFVYTLFPAHILHYHWVGSLYTSVSFCNSEVRILCILGQLFFTQHTYSIYYHSRYLLIHLSLVLRL